MVVQMNYLFLFFFYTENASLRAKIRFADVIRDGVVYYEVKNFDTQFSYGDKITFSLTNLFKGNPELSK